jgi:tetratricopeptide (TPR) repeat protein
MKSVSRFALGVALVLGSAAVATAPADAQKKKKGADAAQTQGQAPQRSWKLSKEERAALTPVETAVKAKDWAAAQAALPAAVAAAQGADAKYFLSQFRMEIGRGTNNVPLQAQATDELIASGYLSAEQLPIYYRNQAILASNAGNRQKAEAGYLKVLELNPNDTDAMISLAQIKNDLKRPAEAVQLLDRAIAVRKAAGTVDETWYRYALRLAYEGRQQAQAMKISRELIAAYPTKENWRDSVLIYRDLSKPDTATNLDLLRFMRATKSLAGERDWYELIEAANNAGAFGEAKAVLDEGVSLKMVDLSKPHFREMSTLITRRLSGDRASLSTEEARALAAPTGTTALKLADAFAGYGDYAKAIPLYRAALTKTGVDKNLINTRLGVALFRAGNRAEAEAAFRAVTGPRADLAGFWLAWLARPVA